MRVTSSSFPDSLLGHLQNLTKDMNRLNEQVATGQRFSKLSEDSASSNRILDMQEEKSRITQYAKNASRAENINNTTISQLENLIDVSGRVAEIATLADDLKGDDALDAYAEEIEELIEHALQSANSQFNGEYIFGGTKTQDLADASYEPFTVAENATTGEMEVTYNGEGDGASFHLSESGTIEPFSDDATNNKIKDFIQNLYTLRDELRDGKVTTETRNTLEGSESDLINSLSRQGSVQLRIQFDQSLNEQRYTDLEANISSEADVDIAQTVVTLTQVQASYQAALQSAGKVLNQSLLDYL